MSDCCSPKGYRWVFSERSARAEAKRYRRKGLDSTSRRIVDFLVAHGVKDRTVLEVGGGIGAIQIELLKAGASRTTSVELTPTYEEVAQGLLEDAGLADRVDRKLLDFAAGAAAGHTRQVLVISYPKYTWWTRIGLGLSNVALQLLRREFHIFVHRPDRIIATTREQGLEPVLDQGGVLWTVAALRRSA